jgi:outer membrane protein TolC
MRFGELAISALRADDPAHYVDKVIMMKSFCLTLAFLALVVGGAPARQVVPVQLTLDEAIRIAERQSPAFRRQANTLERSEITQQRDFRNTFLPRLNGSITMAGSRFRQYTAENFDGVPLPSPYFSSGEQSNANQSIGASFTLFSGSDFMQYRASRSSAQATSVAVESQLTNLRVALSGLFYRVIQADERVGLERRGLERAREDLAAAQKKFDFGLVDREQVLVAERALMRREQALEVEIGNARKLRLDLLQQMGVDQELAFTPVGDLPEPFDPDRLAEAELVAFAVESSPRMRQRQAQVASTVASGRATRASRWPTLTGNISYNRTRSTRDYDSFLELNPQNWGYNARLQLSIPVPYLSYSQNAALALSDIAVSEARDDLRWERTYIENDVRKAIIDLRAAYGAIRVQEREEQLAHELLFILEERIRAGQAIEYDRLESAREAVATAERTVFNTRIAFQNQLLSLEQLVGREIRP